MPYLTNSHFEGLCASNPKAKHGKNKQYRNDCRQVAVGIAFNEHGFPLSHETFEGNMGDTKTLTSSSIDSPATSKVSSLWSSSTLDSPRAPTSSTAQGARLFLPRQHHAQ